MAVADDLSAALAEIRERNEWRIGELGLTEAGMAGFPEGHVRLLLAAIEAALKHHQPVPLFGKASAEEDPDACPHDPGEDWDCHFEDPDSGEWLCEETTAGAVCSCTESPDGERVPWPCDEVADILAALTGKDKADD